MRPQRTSSTRACCWVFSALAVSSCGGSDAVAPSNSGPAIPVSIKAISGDGQTAPAGSVLPQELRVRVVSASATGVAGVNVVFSVASGGGSISPEQATTNASGDVAASWTPGTTAGGATVTASVSGLAPAVFSATVTPGPPAAVRIAPDSVVLGQWGDTARVAAQLTDAFGNTISSSTVVWAASDSAIARVDTAGLVTSNRAGRATIRATAGSFAGRANAVVVLQQNAACRPPSPPTAPGPVAPLPRFIEQPVSVQSQYKNTRTVPLDVDHDGRMDIVLFSWTFPGPTRDGYQGTTQVWRNIGGGTFSDVTAQALGVDRPFADTPRRANVFDANGDGALDVFLGQTGFDNGDPSYSSGAPNLLLLGGQDGTLRDVSGTNLNPNEAHGFTHATAAADVDCDGDIDIYEGNWWNPLASGPTHLLVNDAGGHFTAQDSRLPADVASGKHPGVGAAALCDLDNDGDPDLVLGGSQARSRVLINDGFGRFRYGAPETLPDGYFGSLSPDVEVDEIQCLDYDRDGWVDLAFGVTDRTAGSYATRPYVALLHNNRDMTFSELTASALPQSWDVHSSAVLGLIVADFNGDHWPDLLAYTPFGNYPRLFTNGGGFFFESVFAAGTAEDMRGVELVPIDVDGDGWLDIYVPRTPYQHYVLLNR